MAALTHGADTHALGHDSSDRVCRAACSKWDDHCDRSRRKRLRPCHVRHGKDSSSSCQMQKLTAGKLNFVPPNLSGWAYRISPPENSSASQLKLNNLLVVRKWSDVRCWHIASLRCGAPSWEQIGVDRM